MTSTYKTLPIYAVRLLLDTLECLWFVVRCERGSVLYWQMNFKGCSLALSRLAGDFAAMRFHNDLMGNGQAESGAFADGFRGEKGIEYFCLDSRGHAVAVVCNLNEDTLIGQDA